MYTLHHCPDWASLIVRLVLTEAALPHRLVPLDPDAGDLDRPAYRAISPFGLVPVLETGAGPVFETGAILLYLAERHPGLAPAPDDPARGAFLSWFLFTANTLHPWAMDLIYPARAAGEEGAAGAARAAAARLRDRLGPLDRVAATGPAWLDPARPGILLPYLAVLMRWATTLPPEPGTALRLADTPALAALFAAYEAHPLVAAVAADDGLGPTPFSAPVP